MAPTALALIFGTSFLVGLSGAMMPGPLLALNISQTARRGFWAGPRLVLGHAILEAVLVAALALGLREIFQEKPVVGSIGIIGGVVLIWMGQHILRQRHHLHLPREAPSGPVKGGGLVWQGVPSGPVRGGGLVLQGALVSLSNPYWFVWWVTVGAGYTLWALESGILGISSFYGGHILSDLGWFSLVSLIVATGRNVISDAVYRAVLVGCGLTLLGLGLYFIASGARLFLG
ncbi:MAG: LysE family transporter [Dehalococcoidia bacterium]